MDYAPKSMAAGAASNVDINADMDEVLKRIQVLKRLHNSEYFSVILLHPGE